MSDNFNKENTDTRRFNLVYNFPVFRLKCVSITLTQKDLITIYRQINNAKIKEQLRQFILSVDDWSEYNTDIDNQNISRVELMKDYDRNVTKFDERLKNA